MSGSQPGSSSYPYYGDTSSIFVEEDVSGPPRAVSSLRPATAPALGAAAETRVEGSSAPVDGVPPGAQPCPPANLPANVLGNAEWLPDEAVHECSCCGETFSMFTRKHHCRQCGKIFCHRCCNSKALLQPDSGTAPAARVAAHPVFGANETHTNKPQKVCSGCFAKLLPMQAHLASKFSKASMQPDFNKPTAYDWIAKPVSRSFRLDIKKAVHALNAFLGRPDDKIVRQLIANAHGLALLSVMKARDHNNEPAQQRQRP